MKSFKDALAKKDYGQMAATLAVMLYMPQYESIEFQYEEEVYDHDVDMYYTEVIVHTIKDWSPLVAAAHARDAVAIQMVLATFSQFSSELFARAMNTFQAAVKDCPRDSSGYRQAALFLKFNYAQSSIEGGVKSSQSYSKQEKRDILVMLEKQLDDCDNLQDLYATYNKHIEQSYLTYRRHAIFDYVRAFFSGGYLNYTNTMVKFIEHAQQRAREIVVKQFQALKTDIGALSPKLSQLLGSTMFAPKHNRKGVDSCATLDLLHRIQSRIGQVDKTADMMVEEGQVMSPSAPTLS